MTNHPNCNRTHLWLLRPIYGLENDPWKPQYDRAHGFVVRARTEESARLLAHAQAGDENARKARPWLNPAQSTCVKLQDQGDVGVILRHYHNG